MPKDKSANAKKIPLLCKKTGGKVDDVVYRLLKHGNDDDLDVQNEIFQSLSLIGKQQPLFVVTQSVDFMQKESPSTGHRARVIALMAAIIESETCGDNKEELLDIELAQHIIRFATLEMTLRKNQPQVQNNAVKLLVALSYQHCTQVIDSVLSYFKTGHIPDYYVLKSLADTAKSNPIQFTDKLSEIFTKITPILALVKKADHIQIFTLALGRFAEAILRYQEEKEEEILRQKDENDNNPFEESKEEKAVKGDIARVRVEFATNCAAAFDVVFTNWRKQGNISIKLAVAESIGLLTEVMSAKKFIAKFVDILNYFCTALKAAQSSPEHQTPLTRGICSVLCVMQTNDLASSGQIDDFEKELETAMNVLHPLCGKTINYENQKQVKNHTNILMSFEYMARCRLTQTLTFLLSTFQTKSTAKQQLSSLLILKHLVNAMDDRLDGMKEQILSSCLQLMDVDNMDVRKSFIQLIMAMADQNYLSLEGGSKMISFLVKMSALHHSNLQIKSGADHILHVIASKVHSSHAVLWPYLFELILPHRNQYAVGSVARVLSLIARHKKQQNDDGLYVKWHRDVNLPHPGELLVKLLVLLHRPYLNKNYGEYICALLYNIGEILHKQLTTLFSDNFKIVGKFIKDNTESASTQKKLQSMLLKLFRKTCDKLSTDDSFITEMGDALINQFNHYKSRNDEYLQQISLTFLGQTLAFGQKKSWLSKTLQRMIEITDVKSTQHQKGCALGLGSCSVYHLDTVLIATTQLMQESTKTQKGGLFGFGKKKELPLSKEKRCLCVRSWGYIAIKCPAKSVCSRLDAHVFVHLMKVLANADSYMVRSGVTECINMISIAMNDAYAETGYKVKKRNELIKGMLKYIKISKQDKLKKEAMNAISNLLYLQPPVIVEDELRKQVIDITLKHLNNIPLKDTQNNAAAADDEKESEAQTGNEHNMLQCMQSVLIALLETQASVESLCQLVLKLEFWVVSKDINERISALETYRYLTKRFITILRKNEDLKSDAHKNTDSGLRNLGHYLATIIPRVTDNNDRVRELALDAIQMLLFIDQLLRNRGNEKPSDELRSLNGLKKELSVEKIAETRLSKMAYLSEILCKLCSAQEMQSLLVNLIRGVNDDDRQSALGTCKALQGLLRERAIETKEYVDKLLEINLIELRKFIGNEKKQNILKQQLISICILTREHFDAILNILHTKQSLPLDKATVLVFKAIAADTKLQKKVIEYELNVINESPINDAGITKNVCIATKALQTMLTLSETKPLITNEYYYYRFLATLITRLGTTICKKPAKANEKEKKKKASPKKKNARSPKAARKKTFDDDDKKEAVCTTSKASGFAIKDTIHAIRYLLESAEERLLITNMNEDCTWSKFENVNEYEIGVAEFVDKWCTTRGATKESIVKRKLLFDAVQPYFKKHFVGHRNSAAVVVAELIRHTGSDKLFLDSLVKDLLPRISDGEPRVRRQGLVGLGNLSDVWSDELIATAPAILSSLTSAVEDKIEIVCISAIRSLIKILNVIDINTVTPSLINICFRTRPFMDSENSEVRKEAFKLFGKLCKFGVNNYNFIEQIHKNMTCFVCHINDVNESVSKEVYNTLLTVFKYLKDEKVLQLFEDMECEDMIGKSNFVSLLVKFVPIICDKDERKYYHHLTLYLQAAINYMNTSRWGEIRGNSALFSAKIIQCVDINYAKTHLDTNILIDTTMKLLQSKSVRVRKRTAKALAYLGHT